MKYKTIDGRLLKGESYKELANAMKKDSLMDQNTSLNDYMVNVSKRAWLQKNANVRTDTYEHYILDLNECGLLNPTE